MIKTLAAACTVIACAAAPAAASAATPAPAVLQRFQITLGAGPAPVTASGIVLSSRGTATPTGPASFGLAFPTGNGSLDETVQHSVGGLMPGCTELLAQAGTFTFSYETGEFDFGGGGTFTSTSFTIYRQTSNGGCDTTSAPLLRVGSVNAGATFVEVAV